MVEWSPHRSGLLRPVPEPLATPFVCVATFAGSFLLVAVFTTVAPLSDSAVVLVALCGLAGLLGLLARFRAAPGIAVVCWLFLNGYAVAPRGRLAWEGHLDLVRILLLLVAALVGTAAARIVDAIGAHHRLTPGGLNEGIGLKRD